MLHSVPFVSQQTVHHPVSNALMGIASALLTDVMDLMIARTTLMKLIAVSLKLSVS